jgi:AcrR family transcriptional regulator
LLEVYRRYPSRTAILAGLLDRTDEAVLEGSAPDPAEPVRDRLFEVVMRRFDALKPHKAGIGAVAHALTGDPVSVACLGPRFLRSMGWMLEAAGLDSSGWRGALRAKGLAAVYLAGLRAWLADDTPDSSETMAAVDRALRRAGTVMEWCSRRRADRPAEHGRESPKSQRAPGKARKKPRTRGRTPR